MRKPRKNYTPVEEVAILRHHLIDRVSDSDLREEHQRLMILSFLLRHAVGVRAFHSA